MSPNSTTTYINVKGLIFKEKRKKKHHYGTSIVIEIVQSLTHSKDCYKQFVKCNGVNSDLQNVICDVPQRSILSL